MMAIRFRHRNDWQCNGATRLGTESDSPRIRRILFLLASFCLFSNASPGAMPQSEGGAAYAVKLAFIYNFTKFVEWPAASYRDPGAPLLICIAGHDPFSHDLEQELRTRTAGGRSVEVRTLKPTDALSGCHIVFVPVTEKDQDKIVRDLNGSSTLTVGETEGFAARGGVINLTIVENNVHFEVNELAADRAGLKISSKLLGIAKIIKEQDEEKKN